MSSSFELAGEEPYAPAHAHRVARDRDPFHEGVARIGPHQGRQHAQRRRLAGAVGTEQAVYLAGLHLKRQAVHGCLRALVTALQLALLCGKLEGLAQIVRADSWMLLHRPHPSGSNRGQNHARVVRRVQFAIVSVEGGGQGFLPSPPQTSEFATSERRCRPGTHRPGRTCRCHPPCRTRGGGSGVYAAAGDVSAAASASSAASARAALAFRLFALQHALHGGDGAFDHAVVGLVRGEVLHLHAGPQG